MPAASSTNLDTSVADAPSTSISTPAASSATTSVQSKGPSLTVEQTAQADALRIPVEMRRTGLPLSLQQNYRRYVTYIGALAKFKSMQKDGSWPDGLRKPSNSDIQRLFIGKSTWHDSWSKTFPHLNNHPDMKKWLMEDEDCCDTAELWGCPERTFNFQDLIAWVKKRGGLKRGRRQLQLSRHPPPVHQRVEQRHPAQRNPQYPPRSQLHPRLEGLNASSKYADFLVQIFVTHCISHEQFCTVA